MSTIAAGTSTSTALVNTGDTTGQLVFQTNGTTTAMTIGTNQVITLTQPLPAGSGGTGITSFGTGVATALGQNVTGSGGIALATSPTFTTPVLGTPTSGNLSNCTADGTDAVGFKNIPQNVQTGSYTLVLADAGKHIYRASGSAATWTIPAASSVAYPIGTALTFINLSATSVSIAINTDTMYLSSAGTTGTRTLAQYGSATAVKVSGLSSAGVWIISGSGLT